MITYRWINFGLIDLVFIDRSVIDKSNRWINNGASTTKKKKNGQLDGSSLDSGVEAVSFVTWKSHFASLRFLFLYKDRKWYIKSMEKKLNVVIWRENLCTSKNASFHQPLYFLEGIQLNISQQKKLSNERKSKNKYHITKTWSLAQVWFRMLYNLKKTFFRTAFN